MSGLIQTRPVGILDGSETPAELLAPGSPEAHVYAHGLTSVDIHELAGRVVSKTYGLVDTDSNSLGIIGSATMRTLVVVGEQIPSDRGLKRALYGLHPADDPGDSDKKGLVISRVTNAAIGPTIGAVTQNGQGPHYHEPLETQWRWKSAPEVVHAELGMILAAAVHALMPDHQVIDVREEQVSAGDTS